MKNKPLKQTVKAEKTACNPGIQNAKTPGNRPPFFSIRNYDLERPSEAKSAIEGLGLNETCTRMLLALIQMAPASGEEISIDDLSIFVDTDGRKPLKNSTLKKAAIQMTEMGVLVKSRKDTNTSTGRGRPPTVYTLDMKTMPLRPIPKGNALKQTNPSQMELFEDACCASPPEIVKSLVIDDFWCQFIASILPISTKSSLKRIEAWIYYRNHRIPVVAATRTDGYIPNIRSLRVVMAMLTLIEPEIKKLASKQQGDTLQTRYLINIRDLLKIMRISNNGSRREQVMRDLQAWEDTVFRFGNISDTAQRELNKRFQNQITGFTHHQLISQLCGISRDSGTGNKTLIGLELPTDLVQRIAQRGVFNTFRVTPSIITEKNPMALALHLYCRKMIGYRTASHETDLETLWQQIGQSMTYPRFKRKFMKMIHEKSVLPNPEIISRLPPKTAQEILREEQRNSRIHGYFISTADRGDGNITVTITVDMDDYILGARSMHRKLMEQRKP